MDCGSRLLRRELTACLRTGRALRVSRARTRGRRKKFVSSEILISQRPAEAADRAEAAEVGSASGTLSATQQLGLTAGVAVLGTAFFSLADNGFTSARS